MSSFESSIKERLIVCFGGREKLYKFLGRIYEKEVDEQLIKECIIRKELFLKCNLIREVDADIMEGFMELYKYLNGLKVGNLNEIILELAVDYANLFLGVKYFREKKGIPHPSESVYLTGNMLSEEETISEIYLEAGLIKSPEFKEPYDHIALQLYFMAHLCKKAIDFVKSGNLQDLLRNLQMQKSFLSEHLLKWVPKFAGDVIENSETSFYKAIGKITRGLICMEKDVIEEIIEQAKKLLL
ncbi:MAG: molecular chaperone TorD family protein [Candidatus Bathyarchaeia archaeon]